MLPTNKNENQIQRVSEFMRSDTVKERFSEIVGSHNAGAYISSVLLCVAGSEKLQQCTIESIYISALRAASLRLSCDPSSGQAYIVPFKDRATLIVGWKGLYDMAVRTGRYRFINTGKIYEGEEIIEDRISGRITLGGTKQSNVILGWIAAFEMIDGLQKVLYMTVDEIHAHAKRYSRSYSFTDSPWITHTSDMERKTALRILLRKWGYMDPVDVQTLTLAEEESRSAVDAETADAINEVPPPQEVLDNISPKVKRSEEQITRDLGFFDN